MAEEWAQLKSWDVPFPIGTRLRLHFNAIGGSTYITAAQIAYVENKVEKDKRFRIIGHSLPTDDFVTSFYYIVEITDPGDPELQKAKMTPAVIAAVIITLFFLWIVKDFAEVQVEQAKQETLEMGGETTGVIEQFGITSLEIAAAIIAVILVLRYN